MMIRSSVRGSTEDSYLSHRGGRVALVLAVACICGSHAAAGVANLKLNGPLAPGGVVRDFKISPDGQWVVYRADQETRFAVDLFSVPIEGGAGRSAQRPPAQLQ